MCLLSLSSYVFLNRIRPDPGFVSPIRSDPIWLLSTAIPETVQLSQTIEFGHVTCNRSNLTWRAAENKFICFQHTAYYRFIYKIFSIFRY